VKSNDSPGWLTEAVRAVREAVQSNARTARLAALLLVLCLAAGAVTWGYQVLTARPETPVQVSITVTKS
jgi:hypothetical protein